MQIARSLAVLSLTTILTFAATAARAQAPQSAIAPAEIASAEPINAVGGSNASNTLYWPVEVSSTNQPDAPSPQRNAVIDKKFIAVMAALGGAESLRITTHKLVLDHEYAAGAPWVSTVPANSHVVAKFSGIFVAELLLVYELKKPHSWLPGDKVVRKLWWLYPSTMGPMHVANGVRSIHTQPPSGCPVAECQ